jgi:RHS repeat-associated protein
VQVAYKNGTSEDVYDVHSDDLDTPRLLTDSSGLPVWRASYEAFGRAHVSTDPDGSVVTPPPTFDFNIRFPGQYYDAESGLHDNRHRVYDPGVGRYISADPLGRATLLMGLREANAVPQTGVPVSVLYQSASDRNPYAYAGSNPLQQIDPLGLSYLTFNRDTGTISLYRSDGSKVGEWPANNNITTYADGDWPEGTYRYSYYSPHPESGMNGSYGNHGNFIFDVPGRTGMGVHAGRANLAGPDQPTLGCIRTTDEGTNAIYNTHFGGEDPEGLMSVAPDPLTHINVIGAGGRSSAPDR